MKKTEIAGAVFLLLLLLLAVLSVFWMVYSQRSLAAGCTKPPDDTTLYTGGRVEKSAWERREQEPAYIRLP